MYDLDSLQQTLNTNVTNSVTAGIEDQISKIMLWIVVPTIILSVLILVLYVLHVLRRRKIENAILDIRDTLREMKLDRLPAPSYVPAEPAGARNAEATTERPQTTL